jgi:hypothetical protein
MDQLRPGGGSRERINIRSFALSMRSPQRKLGRDSSRRSFGPFRFGGGSRPLSPFAEGPWGNGLHQRLQSGGDRCLGGLRGAAHRRSDRRVDGANTLAGRARESRTTSRPLTPTHDHPVQGMCSSLSRLGATSRWQAARSRSSADIQPSARSGRSRARRRKPQGWRASGSRVRTT